MSDGGHSEQPRQWWQKAAGEWTDADHEAAWSFVRSEVYGLVARVMLAVRLEAGDQPFEMPAIRDSISARVLTLEQLHAALAALGWSEFWEEVVKGFKRGSQDKFRSHLKVHFTSQLIATHVPDPWREPVLATWLCTDADVFHKLKYDAARLDAFRAVDVQGAIGHFCTADLAGVLRNLDPSRPAWPYIKDCFRNWVTRQRPSRSQPSLIDIDKVAHRLVAAVGGNRKWVEECWAECRAHLTIAAAHSQGERNWRTAICLDYGLTIPPPVFVDGINTTPRLVIDRGVSRVPVHCEMPLRVILRSNTGDGDPPAGVRWDTSDRTVALVDKDTNGVVVLKTFAERGAINLSAALADPPLSSVIDVALIPRNQWIAEIMGVSLANAAVLLTRGHQQLRALLSRFPVKMTLTRPDLPVNGDAGLELTLNNTPYWDTVVDVRCRPGMAIPALPVSVTIPAGEGRWQVPLRATDGGHLVLSAITAERLSPGLALIHVRRAKCEVTAATDGGQLSAWFNVGDRPADARAIALDGDSALVVHARAEFPANARTIYLLAETTNLTSPVDMTLDHAECIGGEDVRGRAILGGRVTASIAAQRVSAFLPLGSRAGTLDLVLASSAGTITKATREILAGRDQIVFNVASGPTANILPATLTASNTRGDTSSPITILPPLIKNVRFSSSGKKLHEPTARIPHQWVIGGAPVQIQVELTHAAVADTPITVRWNHSGVRPADSHAARQLEFTIPKGQKSGQFTLQTDLSANAGTVELTFTHIRSLIKHFCIWRNAIARITLSHSDAMVGTAVEGQVELAFESPDEIPIRLRTAPASQAHQRGDGKGETQISCRGGGYAAPFIIDTIAVGDGRVEITAELFESVKTVVLKLKPRRDS